MRLSSVRCLAAVFASLALLAVGFAEDGCSQGNAGYGIAKANRNRRNAKVTQAAPTCADGACKTDAAACTNGACKTTTPGTSTATCTSGSCQVTSAGSSSCSSSSGSCGSTSGMITSAPRGRILDSAPLRIFGSRSRGSRSCSSGGCQ
jgi:hypothetical protein